MVHQAYYCVCIQSIFCKVPLYASGPSSYAQDVLPHILKSICTLRWTQLWTLSAISTVTGYGLDNLCRLIRSAGSFWECLIGGHCGISRKLKVIHSVITWYSESVLRHQMSQKFSSVVLFCVFISHLRHHLEQRVFIYDCYVMKKTHTNHAEENVALN